MKRISLIFLALILALGAVGCEQRVEKDAEQASGSPEQAKAPVAESTDEPAAQASGDQEPLIWVFRHRRAKQCYGDDMSLEESVTKLKGAGVAVHQSHCGLRTDVVYTSGCGEPTGDILLHLIRGHALDTALSEGYGPAEQIQHQKVECPKDGSGASTPESPE